MNTLCSVFILLFFFQKNSAQYRQAENRQFFEDNSWATISNTLTQGSIVIIFSQINL